MGEIRQFVVEKGAKVALSMIAVLGPVALTGCDDGFEAPTPPQPVAEATTTTAPEYPCPKSVSSNVASTLPKNDFDKAYFAAIVTQNKKQVGPVEAPAEVTDPLARKLFKDKVYVDRADDLLDSVRYGNDDVDVQKVLERVADIHDAELQAQLPALVSNVITERYLNTAPYDTKIKVDAAEAHLVVDTLLAANPKAQAQTNQLIEQGRPEVDVIANYIANKSTSIPEIQLAQDADSTLDDIIYDSGIGEAVRDGAGVITHISVERFTALHDRSPVALQSDKDARVFTDSLPAMVTALDAVPQEHRDECAVKIAKYFADTFHDAKLYDSVVAKIQDPATKVTAEAPVADEAVKYISANNLLRADDYIVRLTTPEQKGRIEAAIADEAIKLVDSTYPERAQDFLARVTTPAQIQRADAAIAKLAADAFQTRNSYLGEERAALIKDPALRQATIAQNRKP